MRKAWRNRSSAGLIVAGEQHQQIDVRVQAELAPAVAAEREDADGLRERARLGEQLLHQRVHAVGVLPQRLAPALAPLGGRRQLDARGLDAGTPRGPRVGPTRWMYLGRSSTFAVTLGHIRLRSPSMVVGNASSRTRRPALAGRTTCSLAARRIKKGCSRSRSPCHHHAIRDGCRGRDDGGAGPRPAYTRRGRGRRAACQYVTPMPKRPTTRLLRGSPSSLALSSLSNPSSSPGK